MGSDDGTASDNAAEILTALVDLIHAWRSGDYVAAADAHKELERHGVRVRLPRRKGVSRAE